MHDVADRAGVARATVYRYFATKDHLLTEVAAAWAHRAIDDIDELAIGDTPLERLTALLERIVYVAAAEPTLTSAIIQAVTSDDSSVDDPRTVLFLFLRDRLSTAIGDPVPERDDVQIVLGARAARRAGQPGVAAAAGRRGCGDGPHGGQARPGGRARGRHRLLT